MSKPPSQFSIFHKKEATKEEKILASQIINSCNICLRKIMNPSKSNNCLHIFCESCIKKWKKVSNCCPICRTTINSIEKIHK